MNTKLILRVICLFFFAEQLRSQKVDTILTEISIQYNYVNFEKQVNTYNQSCNIVTSLRLSWNFTSGELGESFITSYAYNGENIFTKLDQHWDTDLNAWHNDSMATNAYNIASAVDFNCEGNMEHQCMAKFTT